MTGKIIGSIVVVIVIIGGWFLFSSTPAKAPVTTQTPATDSESAAKAPAASAANTTVIYNDQGFSPSSVTVPLGATVTFVNQSSRSMWVASAMHPTHILYSGTSLEQHCPDTNNAAFDQCAAVAQGSAFSFTFNKEGAWKYHNHTSGGDRGTVTVTAATSI